MHENEAEDVADTIYRFLRESAAGRDLVIDLSNGDRLHVKWEPRSEEKDLRGRMKDKG